MISLIAFGSFGPTEIILIILALLLLFGGRKIPELMKGLGQGMKEFKKASKEEDPDEKAANDPQKSINSESEGK